MVKHCLGNDLAQRVVRPVFMTATETETGYENYRPLKPNERAPLKIPALHFKIQDLTLDQMLCLHVSNKF